MQHLDTLWKVINAAGTVRDLAQESKHFVFQVEPPLTLYLHAEFAQVSISHWEEETVEIDAVLQAGFGWRMQTDQDEAGVYLVAKRRAVVGGMSKAVFRVRVPHDTYLVLKLAMSTLTIDNVNTMLEIPPMHNDQSLIVSSNK